MQNNEVYVEKRELFPVHSKIELPVLFILQTFYFITESKHK